MQQKTINALMSAYDALQEIVINLYNEAQLALEQDLQNDVSLLVSQADLLFEVAENLDVVITEQGN